MINHLGLEPAELDAIRELRAGMTPDADDPIGRSSKCSASSTRRTASRTSRCSASAIAPTEGFCPYVLGARALSMEMDARGAAL